MTSTLDAIRTVEPGLADTALVLAASWEQRCLFAPKHLSPDYDAAAVLVTEYDGINGKRTEHIHQLQSELGRVATVEMIKATHADPIQNVRNTVDRLLRDQRPRDVRLTVDTSTYTRKHLVQLLYGLDAAGLLTDAQLIYSQPEDYHTADNEPRSKGIMSVGVIDGFAGSNWPSRDSLLILFLNYEGRRAWAMWDHLEPNQTIAIVPDPPYRDGWRGRTEEQNRFLLSLLPRDNVFRVSASEPAETEAFLDKLMASSDWGGGKFNYRIAPFGTKAQVIGVYRHWRKHPGAATLVYASPGRYRSDRSEFPCDRVLLLDRTSEWGPLGSLAPYKNPLARRSTNTTA